MSETPTTVSLLTADLEEIAARADAATPGPWATDPEYVREINAPGSSGVANGFLPADAEFIAHARQDVPDLLGYIRQLRQDCHRLTARITELETAAKRNEIRAVYREGIAVHRAEGEYEMAGYLAAAAADRETQWKRDDDA